ncbi:MAG: hypothetical protein ILP14_14060 [Oscillospiraceae bacterium]|nr:hypothetical protein [Oscillospiraceae bacterium]
MDVVLNILRCIAILICIYLFWRTDKEITKIVRGEEEEKMIVINRFSIGFRIPDDVEVMREFEKSNDLTRWSRSESTEYIIYTYISVECSKRGEEE